MVLIFLRNTWRALSIRCSEIGCDGLAMKPTGSMLSGLCTIILIHLLGVVTTFGMIYYCTSFVEESGEVDSDFHLFQPHRCFEAIQVVPYTLA